MRFLHTADWQMGMKAAHVGAAGEQVRQARLAAAQRVVAAAREHGAEFLLVAGDTFEDNAIDRVLVQRVADILAAAPVPVFILPGNHDPLVPGSVWEHPAWRSSPRLCVLREEQPIPVPGGTLFPCPLVEKYSPRDPTKWIDARGAGGVAIGLAHGTLTAVVPDERDYPIPGDAAQRAGLDYLALGHWHSTLCYPGPDGACRLAYSGTHETTKFGERDSGNALLVEIPARGAAPQITPLRTGGLAWLAPVEEILAAGDLARVRQKLEDCPQPERTLVDLQLAGVLHPDDQPELARIQELLEARFCFGRVAADRLLPSPVDDAWLAALPPGLWREVADELRQLADPAMTAGRPADASPAVAARALLELYRLLQEAA